ncbi:MAG: 6-phosphofructokinase [Deltaproteobacteria bacterium]|nr:6-phosphofructokinase [Deltaproteobacteria bacterium]
MEKTTIKDNKFNIKHVGILFSGGPAPAANAVISAVSRACINNNLKITGFLYGYKYLEGFHKGFTPIKGTHYIEMDLPIIDGIRNTQGVLIHNSRVNPGASIKTWDDLADPTKNQRLINVFNAFEYYKLDALVSVGGDDTLKTANYLYKIQDMVPNLRPVKIVHVPKTIDNDYYGIDWTFGFFSAAEYAGMSIQNLKADSFSSGNWFIIELMGRKAGWLTYAAGIAGEATKIVAVEDIGDEILDMNRLAGDISMLIEARKRDGENYGVVCIAEGLADKLPDEIKSGEIDSHGNIVLTSVGIGKILAEKVMEAHQKRTGEKVKVIPKQIGYETRCTRPSGFDVILGSQLGVGAYRALVEEGLTGVMISIKEQFDLKYVAFEDLIDQETGLTKIKYIDKKSDFWRLARFLEYK